MKILFYIRFGKIRLRRFCGFALCLRPAKGVTFAGLRPYDRGASCRVATR
jgi:hypothetical protein